MPASLQIHLARHDDRRDLHRLALLDSSDPLDGDVLLGRIDGELRAALSLHDGRVVADPFCRTSDLVRILKTWTS